MWLHDEQLISQDKNYILSNATMNPGPSVGEYVESIQKILNRKILL